METPETKNNFDNIGIGNKKTVTLKPVPCVVVDYSVELVGEGAKQGSKAVFLLKHPDKEDPIKVSTLVILVERKTKKEIVSRGSWVNLDDDKQIQMDSALAQCLRFYNANTLAEMKNKTVQTELGQDTYLAIKCY